MKIAKTLKIGLAVMFFSGMTFTFSSCGEDNSEAEQVETSSEEDAEHPADHDAEHPSEGAEHPNEGAEHPTE
jgi:hypothetical protein